MERVEAYIDHPSMVTIGFLDWMASEKVPHIKEAFVLKGDFVVSLSSVSILVHVAHIMRTLVKRLFF